ncbi:hypothetical protein [Thiorhodococcus minor]|uniref:Uncharacterized protein n=1 Tax=Thiorhodococcus minor TaxID=57489 RepID=A0A6M0JWB8_9GAMM|nr:hypothetical protein [Thiorhodococcus minor]NEV61231.1 hypothetical protein [Thiorhodococcus minor]
MKTLTIVADSVALQMAIAFPGTELHIHARELVVGENCSFSTRPADYPAPAAPGKDGADGRRGGILIRLGGGARRPALPVHAG